MDPFERMRHGKLLTEAARGSRSGVVWPQGSIATDVVYPLLHEIAPQPPSDVVYPLLSELNPQPSSDVVYPLLSELNPQPPSDVVYLQIPNESLRWPSPSIFPVVQANGMVGVPGWSGGAGQQGLTELERQRQQQMRPDVAGGFPEYPTIPGYPVQKQSMIDLAQYSPNSSLLENTLTDKSDKCLCGPSSDYVNVSSSLYSIPENDQQQLETIRYALTTEEKEFLYKHAEDQPSISMEPDSQRHTKLEDEAHPFIFRINSENDLDNTFGDNGSGKYVFMLPFSRGGRITDIVESPNNQGYYAIGVYKIRITLNQPLGVSGVEPGVELLLRTHYPPTIQQPHKDFIYPFIAHFTKRGGLSPFFGGKNITSYDNDKGLFASSTQGVVTFHDFLRSSGNFSKPSRMVILKSIHALGSGKLLVTGWSEVQSNRQFLMMRLNSDGTIDKTFGWEGTDGHTGKGYIQSQGGGIVRSHFSHGAEIHSSVIMEDGKIVVGGEVANLSVPFKASEPYDLWEQIWVNTPKSFIVGRYFADGQIDRNFGDTTVNGVKPGISITNFPSKKENDFWVYSSPKDSTSGIRKIALDGDGRIVAAGYSYAQVSQKEYRRLVAVARYRINGELDYIGDRGLYGKLGIILIDTWISGSIEQGKSRRPGLANSSFGGTATGVIVAANKIVVSFFNAGPPFDRLVLDSNRIPFEFKEPGSTGRWNYSGLIRLDDEGNLDPTWTKARTSLEMNLPLGIQIPIIPIGYRAPTIDTLNLRLDEIVCGGNVGTLQRFIEYVQRSSLENVPREPEIRKLAIYEQPLVFFDGWWQNGGLFQMLPGTFLGGRGRAYTSSANNKTGSIVFGGAAMHPKYGRPNPDGRDVNPDICLSSNQFINCTSVPKI